MGVSLIMIRLCVFLGLCAVLASAQHTSSYYPYGPVGYQPYEPHHSYQPQPQPYYSSHPPKREKKLLGALAMGALAVKGALALGTQVVGAAIQVPLATTSSVVAPKPAPTPAPTPATVTKYVYVTPKPYTYKKQKKYGPKHKKYGPKHNRYGPKHSQRNYGPKYDDKKYDSYGPNQRKGYFIEYDRSYDSTNSYGPAITSDQVNEQQQYYSEPQQYYSEPQQYC